MNRKELKFYEAPASEVVELNVVAPLLAGSIQGVEDPDDLNGGNDDPGF